MAGTNNIVQNVTNDDWDAIISYSNLADWATNDPSNAATAATLGAYYERTYHAANVTGASLQYEFKGTDIYVYGASGPTYGSFSISVDNQTVTGSAYSAQEGVPYLLYYKNGLASDVQHILNITNLGPVNAGEGNTTLLDYIQTTIELAPAGATLVNTTVEDTDTKLAYVGEWGNNSADVFSGGTTHFTSEDGATVSLSFFGSAIYMWGDSNNDHGFFNVTLDGETNTYRPPNGCGGRFDPHQCEKLLPSLKWYAAYLNESEHQVTVTNVRRDGLETFFDLDRFTYTTPSQYLPTNASAGTAATTASATGSGIPAAGNGNASPSASAQQAGSAASTASIASSISLLAVLAHMTGLC